MLSDSFKLYFLTWERQLGLACQKGCPEAFKQGFLRGYRACFEAVCGLDWKQAPVDFDLLEQMIHARNDAQHPDQITSLRIRHRNALKTHGHNLFFATEAERRALAALGAEPEPPGAFTTWMITPALHVSREKLFGAIEKVEMLATWLEERLFEVLYPSRPRSTE